MEGRASATHHYLSFLLICFFPFLMFYVQRPRAFCTSMAALGFKSGFSRDLRDLSWICQQWRWLGWVHICWEDQKAWRDSPSRVLVTLDTISQSWNVPGFLTLLVAHCQGWKKRLFKRERFFCCCCFSRVRQVTFSSIFHLRFFKRAVKWSRLY